MANVRCFMVRYSGRGRRYLRRYARFSATDTRERCPAMPGEYSYHNADSPVIDVVDDPRDAEGMWTMKRRELYLFGRHNSHWPKACACGYVFPDSDEWQVAIDHVYVDDQGGEHTLHDNTPGMMWECDWYFDPVREMHLLPERIAYAQQGKDMLSLRYLTQHAAKRAPLVVCLPTGEHWCIDSKANNGPGWTCEGEPPLLICTPSIQSARWHGFLGSNGAQPGELKSC
jgi:hypothetical protein